jgi:LuxR family maltose regulon positive regulatory protein
LLLVQGLLAWSPIRRSLSTVDDARELLAEANAVLRTCPDPGILGPRVELLARSLTPAHRRVGSTELTERELEVLRHLEKGLSKREVASTLFLSYNTVHSHTRSIYRKLGASSRREAVDRAHEQGLL